MATINNHSVSPKRITGTSKQAGPQQQNAQFPSPANGSTAKGLSLLDEFKSGFPSDGLSVISNKWWGSEASDEFEAKDGDQRSDDAMDDVKLKEETESNNVDISGTSLLAAVRRKAATEGREALKMGLFRDPRGGNDIGNRERSLLGIFHSSLPKELMDDMS